MNYPPIRYPHGCDVDRELEQIAELRRLAHLDGECHAPCDDCDEERKREQKQTEDDTK